ncbi:LysM domain-containing protein [Proteiniborus ethanoligenes]|uniref:LysM domain-containing protein n=1 Tax=Proteiniborus ethanoligenes TaxID=415015 RepID=A0A1H3N942_9FIRM|nr:LysM peptidoglycan-binding domain-containing protein [Proteiniborus ethanoligenes]TAH62734.1 MAG: LysM peptidoglycan-binding domain-containing protein [Gottschalkiaceae bacterium]SDY85471.1 LysM domain-containing protein [Proteiniborus ethanoligenes]
MKRKRIRIANKKRFTIFLSLVFCIITILTSNISKISLAYSSNNNNYKEMAIISGDTLWEIAKRNNPYNQDVRKIVYEIMEFNNMKTAEIKAGSVIKIPTY